MIDEAFLKIFKVFLRVSNLTGGTPFSWNFKEKKVIIVQSGLLRLRLECFNIIILCTWCVFVLFKTNKQDDSKTYYLTFGLIFAGVLDAINMLLVALNKERMAQLLTCTIRLTLDIQNQFMPPEPSREQITISYFRKGSLLLMTFNSATLFPGFVFVHFIFFPDWPCYPTSLIPPSNPWYPILFAVNGVNYFVLLTAIFFNLSFLCTLVFSMALLISPLIGNELRPNRKSYATLGILRQPMTLTKLYRSLEILMKLTNHTLRPVVLPMQSLTGQFSMFCNVTLLTQWNSLDTIMKGLFFIWTLICTLLWTAALKCAGLWYTNARKTTRSWKYFDFSQDEKKYLSKFRKSCRPMGVRVEERYGQFCIKRVTVLKYLKGLSKGTLGALMAIKQNK